MHQNIPLGFQEIVFIVSWFRPDHEGSTVHEKLITVKGITNEDITVSVLITCNLTLKDIDCKKNYWRFNPNMNVAVATYMIYFLYCLLHNIFYLMFSLNFVLPWTYTVCNQLFITDIQPLSVGNRRLHATAHHKTTNGTLYTLSCNLL